jgi:periplasmic divalent cation tolerance protein
MTKPRAMVVLATAPSENEATKLAKTLVEERLAACVNVVGGVRSIYRWEGGVQDDAEVLLVIKTLPAHCEALTTRIQELHSYTCPEAIALPVVAGSEAYLSWLAAEVMP